ncbi:MAG: iron-containing alcohol dehydrogenase [Verrucomicrobia bacterium]|nr:iron-containing alcohol dehydrogenase [Verrucomicrobiota bacterium]
MSVKQQLCIHSGQGNYNVDFFSSLDALAEELNLLADCFLIVDPTVYELYPKFFSSLKKFPIHFAPALESEKTLAGIERLLNFLQQEKAVKNATIVAIGGGVIQDIATFAAHIYHRGVSWIYVPTTLLSMADSCIGAKCGINLNAFKNQLGFFQSPSRVLVGEQFLSTLSDYDLRSGYGEILKLFLIDGENSFEILKKEITAHGFRNKRILEFIQKSLEIKKRIIEEDEYEADLRRILNYGHTFCHSLEAITNHAVPHGLAVAWGVDIANYVSMRKGFLSEECYRMIHDFIKVHFQSDLSQSCSAAELINGMKKDKKATGGNVALILLKQPGHVDIVPTPLDRELESVVQDYFNLENIFSWH